MYFCKNKLCVIFISFLLIVALDWLIGNQQDEVLKRDDSNLEKLIEKVRIFFSHPFVFDNFCM